MIKIDRDYKNLQREKDVFSQLGDIYNKHFPKTERMKDEKSVNFVSVEDAIKELLAMQNETTNTQ
jgi:hypothetical protein